MASDQTFVDQIAGLLVGSGTVEARNLTCDNQVFVKPTEPVLAPPYPGAKPSFRIDAPAADRAGVLEVRRAREPREAKPEPRDPSPSPGGGGRPRRGKPPGVREESGARGAERPRTEN